jgi:AcrR family transcriptional regulator
MFANLRRAAQQTMKTASKVAAPVRSVKTADIKRKYDPEQTKRNIIDIATEEFAAMGLSGARVDAIAERTNTTKRMLYYYFGSKEGLYEAVVEEAYGKIRTLEQSLHLHSMDPRKGLRELVEFTFDFHDKHRDFVRLVTIENIHGAKHVSQLKNFRARNASAVKTIADLITRGVAARQFRGDVDPVDLQCFHRIANRHTFTVAFGRDPSGARSRTRHRQMIVDAVLRFMQR